MKRYNSLDYVKGICCIAVIFIHYNFKGDLGLAVKAMSRFAVPIFFFISGFFFVGKDYLIKREKTIMKIKHLVSLLIKSAIFYAIFCIIWNNLYTQNFNLTEYIDKVISKESIIKFVVTNDPFVYSHLWFILALVYCYITFIPINNKKISKYTPYIAFILLLTYYFFVHQHIYRTISNSILIGNTKKILVINNFYLFRAMPFFLFGMWARTKEDIIAKIKLNKPTIIFGIIFGLLLSLDERFYMGESGYFIGSYIIGIILIIWALGNSEYRGKGLLWYIGRNLSLYVYIFHIAVGKCLDIVFAKYHLWSSSLFMNTRAFIIMVLSILLALLIYKLKELIIKMKQKHSKLSI